MRTITALKWVPPFAQGQVRDHRVRWILNEVGWAYHVRLLDTDGQNAADYRQDQPFGQVPILAEDGLPTMFETGAIVLDVALRAGRLVPEDPAARTRMLCWYFAALNSIEPALMRLAEVEFFTPDEADREKRRPAARDAASRRLAELDRALGDRVWLAGDAFTIADLMTASVLKIAATLYALAPFARLVAYQQRCFARPAYQAAIREQCAEIAAHGPDDMHYPPS